MNAPMRLASLARAAVRNSSSNVVEVPTPRFKRLKELQKKMQIDDGTPVHLKGGPGDKIMYFGTVGLTAVGLGMVLRTFYTITYKD